MKLENRNLVITGGGTGIGLGLARGFADPECRLAFGCTMTRMGGGVLIDQRRQSLVDAAYRCLGYRPNCPGFRIR